MSFHSSVNLQTRKKKSLYKVASLGKRLFPILLLVFSVGVGAFDEGDLQKLKATNKCVKCDLSKANLFMANLSGADLTGVNLTGANLKAADMYEADLEGADLKGADMYEADLEGANLSGANLTCADLVMANLTSANLQGTITRGANLFNTKGVVDPPETPTEYQYRDDYSFTEAPFVHPLLLMEMTKAGMWESYEAEWDGRDLGTVVNLPDANNADQTGCFSIDSDGWVVGAPWDWQNLGEGGTFGYQQIGKTESGLYVLLAKTRIEGILDLDILFIRLERESFLKIEVGDDSKSPRLTNYPRFLLKLVGMVEGVAESSRQCKGEASVKGNKLHIVQSQRDWQEIVIDLETMEYVVEGSGKKDQKKMLGVGTETIQYEYGTYAGELANGVPQGQGTFTYNDCTKYVGEFKDSKYHGQGTFTYNDGTKYVGEFKDGKYHGQGTFTYNDCAKYVGKFKDGKQNGQGTYTWPDETKYAGEYKAGKPWEGTLYDKDGDVILTVSEGVKKPAN